MPKAADSVSSIRAHLDGVAGIDGAVRRPAIEAPLAAPSFPRAAAAAYRI